ncbi:MAG: pleiotropic regulatory protein RsmS [Aeromonas sp.]
MSLETAPPEVKLAVDLIELLETHQLAPTLVLAALAIVKQDYQRKLSQEQADQLNNTVRKA